MLTRHDVPDLAEFCSYFAMQYLLEEAVSEFMEYDWGFTKRTERMKLYDEKVREREAILSQARLLLAQPVFPWRLVCRMCGEYDPDEYFQRMNFHSDDDAIADSRGVLLEIIQKLEATPVPEVPFD